MDAQMEFVTVTDEQLAALTPQDRVNWRILESLGWQMGYDWSEYTLVSDKGYQGIGLLTIKDAITVNIGSPLIGDYVRDLNATVHLMSHAVTAPYRLSLSPYTAEYGVWSCSMFDEDDDLINEHYASTPSLAIIWFYCQIAGLNLFDDLRQIEAN